MNKQHAIDRINEELRDSGNGHYTFEGIAARLAEALRTPGDIIDQGEYGKYVFIKPPSGYEMEIEVDVVKAALGR